MTTKITAKIDTAVIRQRIGRLPHGFHRAIKKSLGRQLGGFTGDYTQKRLSTHSPGSSVGRRSGTLARALTFETTGDRLDRLRGRVFFDSTHITVGTIGGSPHTTYAHVHEYGATIVPKRAKWLTIPIGEALTPAGVARGSIRDFPEGFFLDVREDSLEGLFFVREIGDRIEFLFALKKKVTIQKSLHFISDWKAFKVELLKGLSRDMAKFIARWNEGSDG